MEIILNRLLHMRMCSLRSRNNQNWTLFSEQSIELRVVNFHSKLNLFTFFDLCQSSTLKDIHFVNISQDFHWNRNIVESLLISFHFILQCTDSVIGLNKQKSTKYSRTSQIIYKYMTKQYSEIFGAVWL